MVIFYWISVHWIIMLEERKFDNSVTQWIKHFLSSAIKIESIKRAVIFFWAENPRCNPDVRTELPLLVVFDSIRGHEGIGLCDGVYLYVDEARENLLISGLIKRTNPPLHFPHQFFKMPTWKFDINNPAYCL